MNESSFKKRLGFTIQPFKSQHNHYLFTSSPLADIGGQLFTICTATSADMFNTLLHCIKVNFLQKPLNTFYKSMNNKTASPRKCKLLRHC